MYQAIVFLPLLGAILAGLIALAGARARFPGEGPPPGEEEGVHASPHAAHAAHGHANAHDPHAHDAHAHEPAAAGSRSAELITTTLLLISMILSWIAFVQVGFAHHDMRVPVFTWIPVGRPEGGLVAAHRHAHRGDAGGGEYDIGLRAPLFHRLHGGGPVPAALLRVPVAVHLLHADAGDRRQSGAAVLRLGRASGSRATC